MSSIVLIFLTMILASIYSVIPKNSCNRLKIGDQWYEREILWANIARPYNLIMHKATNTIFFSYSLPETFSNHEFQLAIYNIDKKDCQIITGIKGGCSIAIDQDNDTVYMGGSDGIFKYNMLTNIADAYAERGKNIWSLFYKRNLFYISYPDQKLHILIDRKFSLVKEFENYEVDNFYVTGKNEIYFANTSGLYKFNNEKLLAEPINELLTVRSIVEDNHEKLYFCTNFGIYIDGRDEGLKKVIDMNKVYGITFDRDNNLIYSDENSIVRLMYSKSSCKDSNNYQGWIY